MQKIISKRQVETTEQTPKVPHTIINFPELWHRQRYERAVIKLAENNAKSSASDQAKQPAEDRVGKGPKKAVEPMSMSNVLEYFNVKKITLLRQIKAGKIKSYRPENCAKNAQHLFDPTEIARLYSRKSSTGK